MPTRSRYRLVAMAAGAAAVLAACSDDGFVAGADVAPAQPRAMMAYSEPSMDPADTYVSMESDVQSTTTVTLAQPVYDASTGQPTTQLTFTGANDSRTIEAGYDYYDRVLSNTYRKPDGVNGEYGVADPVRTIKTVGSDYNQYDAGGSFVPADKPDGAVHTSPLTVLGPLQGVSITQGIVIEDASSDPGTPRPQSTGGLDGEVDFPNQGTMRITSPLFGETSVLGAPAIQSADASRPNQGTLTRTYKRHGKNWVLQEVVSEATASTSEATFTTREVTRLRNVRFRINKEKEAKRQKTTRERAEAAGPQGRQASSSSQLQSVQRPCEQSYLTELCSPIGPGREPEPYTPPPPPAGSNVVFQHGIFSNAGTWARMDPWLSQRFYFNTKLVPSLSSTDRLYNQATDLIGRISATGQNNFVLVGHSQGGLISRSVAQRRGDLARGVVTIGSPHQGALLARNGRTALADFLNGQLNRLYFGCSSPYQDPGCYVAWFISNYAIDQVLQYAIDAAVPAQIDLQPGNAFVGQLNSTPEYFTRVGIQSYADKRFILARLGGDAFCNPESGCGGRAFASYAQWAYNGFVGCSVIASLLGYWNTAYWCAYISRRMDDVDRGWDQLTAPGMTSDGIVQGPSQVYPNANRQYPINGGDSHVGETKSDKTRDRLITTLDGEFAVPRRF
ncbi:MAG TPA: alpha/beta hydrolase [Longimicrobiaceae bacterium]|nr:alpha/beta hydrolase [Longimicrobiaceae bacterium]